VGKYLNNIVVIKLTVTELCSLPTLQDEITQSDLLKCWWNG